MRISEFVVKEALIPNLMQTTKEGVIREMVEALKRTGHIKASQVESIVKALLKREQLGSTGIGHGVAIPHTKHEGVDRLIGTVAVSHQGVDFQSIDNEPVYIFVLLISPIDRTGEHLRALENVTRNLRNETFCRFLRQATTAEEIWELILEAEGSA
ncbi:MAG: PTS sugar transporter subunit IIA [Gemmatales bacterium]|nr:PTS sugar transporter subunit IIA [Gemmatales bacterium]MDW7994971.1 PTS sugar transporter subunit IIA [Gemmatales bacterium]